MIDEERVEAHYSRTDLAATVLAALKGAGKDIDRLTVNDLAPIDEFHTRGRAATVDMARLLALSGAERVLDLGSGLGGPSRYLAATFGCRVTGLDLTRSFVEAATSLARRLRLDDKVDYRHGSALAMPFAESTFDVVWSQNAVMNIADRGRLYAEIRRVLRPGGRYAFSDIVRGAGGTVEFPVPWAAGPETSFLLTADETRAALDAAGFRAILYEDQSADAIAQYRARAKAPPSVGREIIVGPDWPVKEGNVRRAFEEGALQLLQGVVARGD